MVTYNQERYIAQAIESVLMQETDFPYEIIVGEDESTDSTRGILLKYGEQYPDRVRLLLNPRNLGLRNFGNVLAHCRGEYVALLEGDDYWTSKEKLQKQVEFLDQHPECCLSFHSVLVECEAGAKTPLPRVLPALDTQRWVTVEDILRGNFISTCSVMYRREALPERPRWLENLPIGDWPTFVLLAQKNPLAYLPEILATYRVHGAGMWSTHQLRAMEGPVKVYEELKNYLPAQYQPLLSGLLAKQRLWLASHHAETGDLRKSRILAGAILRDKSWPADMGLAQVLKALLKIYFPGLRRLFLILMRAFGRQEIHRGAPLV